MIPLSRKTPRGAALQMTLAVRGSSSEILPRGIIRTSWRFQAAAWIGGNGVTMRSSCGAAASDARRGRNRGRLLYAVLIRNWGQIQPTRSIPMQTTGCARVRDEIENGYSTMSPPNRPT